MSERIEPIGRRQALRTLSASALVPLLHGFHPLVPREEGGWKPRFFQDSEVETVSQIAERIIPATDTPGARGALVHQYIDFILSGSEASARDGFREGIRSVDRKCHAEFGKSFAELEPGRQDEVLTGLSETPFFQEVKRLTVDGYYRSEVAMKQELGFEGNTYLSAFEGCTHPEHKNWKAEEHRRAGSEPSEERGDHS